MFRSCRVSRYERDVMLPAVAALCLFILLTVVAGGANAQGCIDYRDYLRWVGGVDTPGEAVDVAVAGDYAYVADVGAGLQVVSISDPAAPRIVGSTAGASRGVAVAGAYACVADGVAGLEVVDISVPEAPVVIGSVPTPGVAWDVALAGSHACVVDALAGLQVVDITDPASPAIVGSVAMADSALDVAVSGSFAYVTAARAGLQVVDISDPALPAIVGSVAMAGSARGVAVAGSYAYVAVAGAAGGLQAVDISNPAMPAVIGSVVTGSAHGVVVAGHYAYVAESFAYIPSPSAYAGRLLLVDISDPASPAIVGGVVTWGDARGVAVAGNHAYVVGRGALGNLSNSVMHVVDISNPLPAPIVGSVSTGRAFDVAVAGEYAYMATEDAGLQIVDVSAPASPVVVWSGGWDHGLYAVAVAGDYAYVAGTLRSYPTFCIIVYDISNPASPTFVGHEELFSGDPHRFPYDLAVAGDYAYITDVLNTGSFVVVDISNPASLHLAGVLDTGESAFGVAVAGDYAYLGNASRGLQVVDISNPALLVIVGGVPTPCCAAGVALAGDRAYVTGVLFGLKVVDISNPTSPVILGGIATPGLAFGVALAGDYAYIADDMSGLQVVDISNPALPSIVGGVAPSYASYDLQLAVAGDYVYVAEVSGLSVCPAQCAGATPVELASYEITADDGAVHIEWETSFVADHLGFHVERAELGSDRFVRVTQQLIGGADGRPLRYEFVDRSVEVGRTYVYRLVAVDLRGGTQVFAIGSVTVGGVRPGAIVLHQNQPNPFGASTSIAFELPAVAPVTLLIYDAHGRLVRTLAGGIVSRGAGSFEWDGRDDRGRKLGTGVYVYRLNAGGRTLSKNLLMLR